MKDRDQKSAVLRMCVSKRWLPQLEVDVHPGKGVGARPALVTDLDVYASLPDEFKGFRSVVFDCKTRAKESAVTRALWLAGVLQRMGADQGFCVLKRDAIEIDHRLMAARLNVVVLAEDELGLYATATTERDDSAESHVGDIGVWERLFALSTRFPRLAEALTFARSGFWMVDEAAEGCRKLLAHLRDIRSELDPAKPEHMALFLDLCAVFARGLAVVICQVFRSYLHPKTHNELSGALRAMLYGGREAYEHRNDLFRFARSKGAMEGAPDDLSLPEWDTFLKLARQLLDAPLALQRIPLILRETGFSLLAGDREMAFARKLCSESPQGSRFAVLVASYLCKAGKLPNEFLRRSDEALLAMVPVR